VRGKKALEHVMVRRLKEDIRNVQGGFPKRNVDRVVIDRLPEAAPELVLSRLLDEFARLARHARKENVILGGANEAERDAGRCLGGLQGDGLLPR